MYGLLSKNRMLSLFFIDNRKKQLSIYDKRTGNPQEILQHLSRGLIISQQRGKITSLDSVFYLPCHTTVYLLVSTYFTATRLMKKGT